MRIFAIGDLHLPGNQEKPMDVFGAHWADHGRRIASAWEATVGPDDVVLMPGDLSWAMTLDEAIDDLAYLGALPGDAIIIRGNHDYWWSAIGKVRQGLPPGVHAIQNDFVALGEVAVCGTRGWSLAGHRRVWRGRRKGVPAGSRKAPPLARKGRESRFAAGDRDDALPAGLAQRGPDGLYGAS